MRAVVSRVTGASVTVAGEVVAQLLRPGLLVLVGITHSDTPATAARLARKIAGLRILRDEASALDLNAPVLVVSQFTLYGDTSKGRRPSWIAAAAGEDAEPLVDEVVAVLRADGLSVQTGRFGAQMSVASVNDGPFTVLLDL